MPLFLDYLLRYSHKGQDGFIKTNDIIELFQNNGFRVSQIEYLIPKSVFKGLVETEARKILNIGDPLPHACRITTAGAHHIQRLIPTFLYIDAIIIDKNEGSIFERLDSGLIFYSYLDSVWESAKFEYSGFDWKYQSEAIKNNINSIRKKIQSSLR